MNNSKGALIRDTEGIALRHKGEPVARVRRLRSRAMICMDDVVEFSNLLQIEYPDAVYFFLNFKTGQHRPPKYSDDTPHRTLQIAT